MIALEPAFIAKCKKGDRAAQKQLFEKLYAPMYRVCFRYIGKQADAEDCLMKGFMKCFQNIDSFEQKDENGFYYWVKKIMVNESLMELRKQSTLSLVPTEELHYLSEESDVLNTLSAEEIYNLILQLPTGYRTVFNLFVVEGLTHAEIAESLNITESTSRTQLAKARKNLQLMLEKMNMSYGTFGR
ncbi:MAG: sigma-70 family RNA polymerase sigma factor [Sphingobacteriales bacterium]|nr:MAG: sigma-70 family RNA polymerase sigma factor [Sphingobacteriales bacterium]